MEDHSAIHHCTNPNPQNHHPPHQFSLASLQSPRPGYTSAKPPLDSLEPIGNRGEQTSDSFPTSSTSWGSRECAAAGRGYHPAAEDEDGAGGLGGHFGHAWSDCHKTEGSWDERGSCEGSANDFYGKYDYRHYADEVFHDRDHGSVNERDVTDSFHGGVNERDATDSFAMVSLNVVDKADCNRSDSHEAKYEIVYNKDTNIACYANHNMYYNRDIAISHRDSGTGECRTDGQSSRSDGGMGVVEDPCSSQSSSEDPSQDPNSGELKPGTWVIPVNLGRGLDCGGSAWRGGADSQSTASAHKPPLNNGTYAQKLDSFSDAFQSYQKRGFPLIHGGIRVTEGGRGVGLVDLSQSSFNSSSLDSYVAPHSSSSSLSYFPSLPSLPSLHSPPLHPQLMPSVLSPPPTPLPPSSLSPSQMENAHGFAGTGHSSLRDGETIGMLQFFPSHFQSSASCHPSGVIWKLPGLAHCFPQQPGDPGNIAEGNLRPSHSNDVRSPPDHRDVPLNPEAPFTTSSRLHPSRRPDLSTGQPPLRTLLHPPQENQRLTPYMVPQEGHTGPPSKACPKNGAPLIYRGTPFPSMLHSREADQRRGHYTPPPVLNPSRRGAGLYFSVAPYSHIPQKMARGAELEEQCVVAPCINIGPDFQAELPTSFPGWGCPEASSPPAQTSPREQLLWKPWGQLEESASLQGQVEMLLSMCTSSCLPGGGANTELALHCLHYCQGNTMATLEMLLLSLPSPTGDYHYSGSDVWTEGERTLFHTGLVTGGKDFSLIQKMVRTKSVRQCVEFYYLGKKLLDIQRRQREVGMDQQVSPIPQPTRAEFGLERAVPIPPVASFFPCKMCGKMFYKIKSRNAHMKIHRQPQEDWRDGRLQQQLMAHRLAMNAPPNMGSDLIQASPLAYSFPCLTVPSSNDSQAGSVLNSFEVNNSSGASHDGDVGNSLVAFGNTSDPNLHLRTGGDSTDPAANQRRPPTIVSSHQPWSLFGLNTGPSAFYCDPEVKGAQGVASRVKGTN